MTVKYSAKRPRPEVPDGFDSEMDFIKHMREEYDRAVSADEHNIRAAEEDVRFTYGDQWPDAVKSLREKARKPVLTINRMPANVALIVNNRLLNETEIRVYPDRDGDTHIAEVREGIIRSIFKNSESDFARDEAMKYQVTAGLGAFYLCLDYESDDVFDQTVTIKPIVNPLTSVAFDPLAVLPCAGDAQFAFVSDTLSESVFKKRYPWASVTEFDGSAGLRSSEWFSPDGIRVTSYWRMVERGTRTIFLTVEGTTQEAPEGVEGFLEQAVAAGLVAMREDGQPYVRQVPKRYAEMYLCSGANILEGPYRLPVSSLPVFRVPGWEFRVADKVHRWGLVRFLKDPQRLHNYWRSSIAEQLVSAPRNKWVATREAVSGFEKEWRASHLSDDPLLIFNAEGGRPERVAPPPADAGLLAEAANTVQDIRDVSNIHEASLGLKSNEVSGKAIQARQQMTDLASFIYHDRLRIAEERCARLCNELIPHVYDSTRIVTIMGPDNKAVQAVINDPSNPATDISAGRYAVTVTTGPSTVTKRAMAAEQMMAFVNALPQTAAVVMDLVASAQDWPHADEFARRFRVTMPPGIIPQEDIPEEMQVQMQQQAEEQQQIKQIEMAKIEAEIEAIRAESRERMARAQNLLATAQKALSDADARQRDVSSKVRAKDFDSRARMVELAKDIDDDE